MLLPTRGFGLHTYIWSSGVCGVSDSRDSRVIICERVESCSRWGERARLRRLMRYFGSCTYICESRTLGMWKKTREITWYYIYSYKRNVGNTREQAIAVPHSYRYTNHVTSCVFPYSCFSVRTLWGGCTPYTYSWLHQLISARAWNDWVECSQWAL